MAAGAGQAAFSNSQPMGQNDGGGFGVAAEPSNPTENMGLAETGNIKALGGGLLQGGNSLGGGEMLSDANMGSNSFPGTNMKKVSYVWLTYALVCFIILYIYFFLIR